MTLPESKCFVTAWFDELSDEHRIWHAIQHMRGARHRQFNRPECPNALVAVLDPVMHSIQTLALKDGYKVLNSQCQEQPLSWCLS